MGKVLDAVLDETATLMAEAYGRDPCNDPIQGAMLMDQVINLLSANLGIMAKLKDGDQALSDFIIAMKSQPQKNLECFVMQSTIVAASCFKTYAHKQKMPRPAALAVYAAMFAGVEMTAAPEIPETTDVEAVIAETVFLASVFGGCSHTIAMIGDLAHRVCDYTSAHHLATINAIHQSWRGMNCGYQFRTLLAAVEIGVLNKAHGSDAADRSPVAWKVDASSAPGPRQTPQ